MEIKLKNSIKSWFSPVVKGIVSNNFSWKQLSYFLRFSMWLKYEKSKLENIKIEERLKLFFKDKVVRSGFFEGLKYVGFDSVGSSIFPKLLGSYEIELLPVFDSFKSKDYIKIIDIINDFLFA